MHDDNEAKSAAQVLKALDEMGAINLRVLVERAREIRGTAGSVRFNEWEDICYPFFIHIGPFPPGPRPALDTVLNDLEVLGFKTNR